MSYKNIEFIKIDEVDEITLLSRDELSRIKSENKHFKKRHGAQLIPMPQYRPYWWLRSPGKESTRVLDVAYYGDTETFGNIVSAPNGVCPAFKIPSLKSEIGSKILVENTVCTVIDKKYALADNVVCFHRFDSESNDYDRSEIKQFLNSDEFKAML